MVSFQKLKGYSIHKGDDEVAKVMIEKDTCKGCGLCVTVCPKNILRLSETEINAKGYSPIEVTDMSLCIGCAACARMCPDIVFRIEK